MLTIRGKSVGARKPLFADFAVAPPPGLRDDGGITLRDLIDHVVREEVAAFQKRQRDRLTFRVLTAGQISEGVERGKVESGGSEIQPQDVDPNAAVGTAIQAFEDGLYFAVIDERQAEDLDRQVFLQPDSQITFIRLTLLSGG
ncbi:MAG TPA: hypothetical protein DD670_03920 [Planctomycetaceae bacterium]|nr:hypothetical protein [Planctomycetaceae bacterium]